ncbi:MAG TPA: NF038122 family metalloprotease, partial [Pyrinomonadaceae bacterium]|nr:NF038122 family metalloprotease [Pyrinomonadaceae bacterium]
MKSKFFAPATQCLTSLQPLIYQQARTVLALALTAFILLPSLALTTSAHTVSSSGAGDSDLVDSFIIDAVNGGAACREARPEEVPLTLHRPEDVGVPVAPVHLKNAPDQVTVQNENSATGLTINFVALSQLQSDPQRDTVIAAFQRAAAVWTNVIKTPVTVTINIDYGVNAPGGSAFPGGVLGSTSSRRTLVDFPSVRTNLLAGSSGAAETATYNRLPSTAVPTDVGNGGVVSVNRSLAFALGLPVSSPADDTVATMGFNKNFSFDFNPDNGVTPGTVDFISVATHEIGHALGFTSGAGQGSTSIVTLWDLFRFRPGTTTATFPNAQRVMSIGGEQVYFTGETFSVSGQPTGELGLSTGGPDPGSGDGDGRQSSHWKDDALTGNFIGIMDPTVPKAVAESATSNDFATLETLGWNLINSTAPPPAPPPPLPPANDNFASAQTISGCSGSVGGTNIGATREPGEPIHSPDGVSSSRSVWYRWQSPSNGSVTVTTAGSRFDTVLGVYTGNSVGGLTQIGAGGSLRDDVSDTDKTSTTSFNASQGTTYSIAVDGYNNAASGGDFGPLTVNWTASNCTAASNNPIDDPTFFVTQHYHDFLNRNPDTSGLNFWVNEITSCGNDAACIEVKRINVSAAFYLAIEFQETGYLAYRTHKAAFGNLPGAPVPIVLSDFLTESQQIGQGVQVNVGNWQAQLEANKQAYMLGFVQRGDFLAAFPTNMNATDFVTQLNTRAGGVLSAAEQTNLINTLAANPGDATLRSQVLRAVAEDPDLKSAEFNRAFVMMQYFGYLRRNPNDPPNTNFDGYNFWLGKLNQFNGDFVAAEMVKAFI